MLYNKGFSAAYYAALVDPVTWRDAERIEITEGNVARTAEELRATASFNCVDFPQRTEQIVRLYIEASQNGQNERHALFTGLACSPSNNINGTMQGNSVECYSILKYAQDILLERGWFAPVEVQTASIIRQLMEGIPAPIEIEDNSPELAEAIVAESGENKLSMIDKILTAIGWTMTVLGDGTIRIAPEETRPKLAIDPVGYDIIEPELEVTRDWYSCPNVFRATAGDLSATARDDSETSYLSTVNRGREIWMEETDVQTSTGESVAEYAIRRLKEEQRIQTLVKYNRRFVPDIYPGDVITLNYPGIGISGLFRVDSQTIELTHGARTAEEVTNA